MLGVSRSVRAGQTVGYEFVLLREAGEGRIEYTARPSGQAEATFVLVRLSASEVIFENPGHDFPQRISYRLDGPERLMARIEGEIQGQSRAVDFPMRRISCAADPEGPAEPEE